MNTRHAFRLALSSLVLLSACTELKSGNVSLDGWSVEVTVDPFRQTYLPGELVSVHAEVRTADGALINHPILEWSADGATEEGEERYRLAPYEALARITACLHIQGESVCGFEELPIDVSPPTVVIETPQPGDYLLSSDTDPNGHIRVSGTIVDTNPDARLALFVNGISAPISNGRFDFLLPSQFGITHLFIEGSDGFHSPTRHQMDVLLADAYLPPEEGTTRFNLESAMAIRLTQKFFDGLLGGSALNLSVSPIIATDVAEILELVLFHIDLSGLFGPGPVIEVDDVFSLSIVSVTIDDPIADLALLEARGLKINLDINDIFVELDGFLDMDPIPPLLIQGGMRTDLRGSIVVELGVDAEGQLTADVDVENFGVASLHPSFTGPDGPELNALTSIPTISDNFRHLVQQQFEGDLVQEFVDVIPEVLIDVLGAIGGIFEDFELELPLPEELGDPITIRLDSRLSDLSIAAGTDTGFLDVELDLTVETLSPPLHNDHPGMPQAHIDPTPPFTNALGLQLAIRQDFINGLLHSLWNAGLLDVQVEVGGLSAVVVPHLPPVLRMAPLNTSCVIDGVRCDAIIQIGQVEVEALGAVSAVSLEAGLTIEFRNNAISLKLQQDPQIKLWEVVTSSRSPLLNGFLMQFLENDILPALTNLVGEELLIELPLPDPASLGLADIAPGLADASLDITTLGRIEAMTGYLGLGADIRFVVP